MKYLLIAFLLVVAGKTARSQSFYYLRTDKQLKIYVGLFDIGNCKDSLLFEIDKSGFTSPLFTDIAISPSGDIFFIVHDFLSKYIGKLNKTTQLVDSVYSLPYPCNSLTCSADNVLFAASSFGLFSYDLNNNVGTNLGPVNFSPAGDLTFRDGKLYCTSTYNELIEVNITDPDQSSVVFTYPLQQNYYAYGVVSILETCDSIDTYITVNDATNQFSTNYVYKLDIENQTVTFLCNLPGLIMGATSPNEFRASDCSVRLDLDGDDSSGASGSDYQAAPPCAAAALMVADTDAVFYSGYRPDSVQVRLLSPWPDGPAEYLTAPGSATVGVTGQLTPWLTLTRAGAAQDHDFLQVLRQLRWHDDALPPTPGPRTVEVIAFASGGHTDTAYAFIPVAAPATAGRDTAVALCPDAPPLSLGALLASNAAPGGAWWSPDGNSATPVFTPGTDTPGDYLYVTTAGLCPSDSARIGVSILTPPAFTLGPDEFLCPGATRWLALTPAPATVRWQDGSVQPAFPADQAGLFWAEATDANGCHWRDSILLSPADTFRLEEHAALCAGASFQWQGMTLSADTALCRTYTSTSGCDSTHCLQLTFFYPSFSLDTAICTGAALLWQGGYYDSPGVYQDTVWMAGCLTAATLRLQLLPAKTTALNASICPGRTYDFNGLLIGAPGVYFDTLSAQNGCDSIVMLLLTETPSSPPTALNASICPGRTYDFNGLLIGAPGVYFDTLNALNGCDSIVMLLLTETPSSPPTVLNASICPGRTYDFNGLLIGTPGVYFDTLNALNGCDSIVMLILTETPPPPTALTAFVCPGSGYDFNGQIVSTPGVYFDTLSAQNGCDSVVLLTLQHWPVPPPPLFTGDTVICLGATATLGAPGYASWAWSNGAATAFVTLAQAGIYTVTVTNEYGCSASGRITLAVTAPPAPLWQAEDPSCYNRADGFIELASISGGAPPYQYQLSGYPASAQPFFGQLAAGPWTILCTDSQGCADTQSVVLHNPLPWTLTPQPAAVTIQAGETVALQALASPPAAALSWTWQPPLGLSCTDCPNPLAQPADTTVYFVTATTAIGCTAAAQVTVFVLHGQPALYVPNVFSPDDDGQNDFFTLFADPNFFDRIACLRIYDRWGSLLFDRADLPLNADSAGWDGYFNGKLLPPGVYAFQAELLQKNGQVLKRAGEVTLLR